MGLNSFDKWSRLRDLIVGSAANYVSHECELSFDLFFHDNIRDNTALRTEWYYPCLAARTGRPGRVPIKRRYVDELTSDADGVVDTLQSLSVTIHRPVNIDPWTVQVRTPASALPPLNIRGNTLIVGDEIIEPRR